MAKHRTKDQREADAKDALRQRIEDIALGAEGEAGVLDSAHFFANAIFLSRFLPALKAAFGTDESGNERQDRKHFWYLSNLDNYDTVDTTTEFLWNHGVRA